MILTRELQLHLVARHFHLANGVHTYDQLDAIGLLKTNDKVVNIQEVVPVGNEADIQKAINAIHDWATSILKANAPAGTVIHEYPLPTPPP